MKVVFADVDGVMNSCASKERAARLIAEGKIQQRWTSATFGPWSVEALNLITDTTGAGIVISSTWRRGALRFLRQCGVRGDILDTTPRLGQTRGAEIAAWLESWPRKPGAQPITHFVILDDDADMDPYMDHLVQTSPFDHGLTELHAERAIELLTR